jgi:hypothetical protein
MSIVLRKPRGAALESHLKGTAQRWLAAQGLMPFEEFQVSWGIVDVVGIKVDVDQVIERVGARQVDPIGDYRTVVVLRSIPLSSSRRSTSLEQLQHVHGEALGESVTERIVQKLVRKRMIQRTSDGRYVRTLAQKSFHEELICIELKLSRVDEALAQARRHQVIAARSYVGLPAAAAERVAFSPKRQEFEDC